MLRLDSKARQQRPKPSNSDGNMSTISMEAISGIEKELLDSPYDIISLVFLLYKVPDTALQRLLVYQGVTKNGYSTNMNLLQEWMLEAKVKLTWREEFLEALLICQLYGIVRKLGFDIDVVKRQYQPDNVHFNIYVNRTKKTLYKLCENIDSSNLIKLKKTLKTYSIDTTDYDSCELVFLKLMSEKIICLSEIGLGKKILEHEFNFQKFVKLIQKLPGLQSFANELWVIDSQSSGECMGQPIAGSFSSWNHNSDISVALVKPAAEQHNTDNCFDSLYEMLGNLNIDENNMKSDSRMIEKDRYEIKDPKKIGVCLIINQEVFHFCDQSIEDENQATLPTRNGSTFDKFELVRTMSDMNFEVITEDNLNSNDMMNFIKDSIKKHVKRSTSVFMLCIMSHGVRDHVYAADSIKVKVEDIQNLLDSDDVLCLSDIPKVLIIQACQVDDIPQTKLVADAPSSNQFRLRKMDFLVYWATSPKLEAFRSEGVGSIFIQFLCKVIRKLGKQERLEDIFTKVNGIITTYCKKNKVPQAPVFMNSLIKKLYLFDPQAPQQSIHHIM